MTEAIPISATNLLPIVLFPLLGIMHTKAAAAPYASHLIFLFMGGFIIALAMQRWNLHRRVAMNIVKVVGISPSRLIFGFMVATAALSAFVSNTATTVMMMPIGLAIIHHVIAEGKKDGLDSEIDFSPEKFAFGLNLMLGIAYAASIGGIATLIETPPNTVLAGYLTKTYGYEITFANWILVGVPLVVIFLPLCWLWLIKVADCAFMLPVATPPNAIVFGSGYVTIPQMVKSGFGLNILGIFITVAITFAIVIPLFGIELGVIPDGAAVLK